MKHAPACYSRCHATAATNLLYLYLILYVHDLDVGGVCTLQAACRLERAQGGAAAAQDGAYPYSSARELAGQADEQQGDVRTNQLVQLQGMLGPKSMLFLMLITVGYRLSCCVHRFSSIRSRGSWPVTCHMECSRIASAACSA